MSIDDYIEGLENVAYFLKNDLPQVAAKTVAKDLVASISERVIKKGESANGTQFTAYSHVDYSADYYIGQSRNSSAEAAIQKLLKDRGFISYAEFRELNNLPTDKKTFNFTGDMWKSFGIKNVITTEKGFIIKLGGLTKDAQDKIDSNSDYEKVSIIDESNSEENIFFEDLNDIINDKIKLLLK